MSECSCKNIEVVVVEAIPCASVDDVSIRHAERSSFFIMAIPNHEAPPDENINKLTSSVKSTLHGEHKWHASSLCFFVGCIK